jgi:signal transduction histidine kinase
MIRSGRAAEIGVRDVRTPPVVDGERGLAATVSRYRWAVRIRWLAIGGFLVLGVAAWAVGVLPDPRPCVVAATGASLLNLANHAAVRRWRWVGPITLLAVFGDVFLITYLVVSTGGSQSPFVAMYGVQVLAAAMLVELRLAMACTAVAVITLVAGVAVWSPAAAPTAGAAAYFPVWSAFFAFGLAMVAYVGGHVSEQLRQREHALEASNAELSAALRSVEQGNAELRSAVDRLEQTERQLAQSEKMRALGDFVAGVAHELNNPIAIVTANLQILGVELSVAARAAESGAVGESLRDCEEAAARAARIVSDLRQFSRAGGARQWGAVDLNQRITRTVELARHLFGAGVAVEVALRGRPIVHGIAPEIDQVLLNLLSNAAQAVEKNGRVQVSTEIAGDARGASVRVRVADDGPGIPPELADRIFEPFFTTRPEGQGVGLGLSLSFAIVERHGGSIRLDSAAGRGACFEISLPIDQTASAAG